MATEKLTVQATITAKKQTVWDYYTLPEHITQWNFADPSWHCPTASNNLTVGGKYFARMEAKDGSFGFDFEAVYTEIHPGNSFTYVFGERYATVSFQETQEQTEVTLVFDPETENPLELQKQGWQAILNHFKKYVETIENN
ncbi:MAG: SRPBCC domain-containing protein [Spirosomataceae bacterium]